MIILDMSKIRKSPKDTEYELVKGDDNIDTNDRVINIIRHNIGLSFKAELTFDEYCWVFGDRRQDKFNSAFEIALCEFIREKMFKEESL